MLRKTALLAGDASLNLATGAVHALQPDIRGACTLMQGMTSGLRLHGGVEEPTLTSSVWCSRSRPGSDLMSTPVRACLCASAEVLCAFPLPLLQPGISSFSAAV